MAAAVDVIACVLPHATAVTGNRAFPRIADEPRVVRMRGCPACVVVLHVAEVLHVHLSSSDVEGSVSVREEHGGQGHPQVGEASAVDQGLQGG